MISRQCTVQAFFRTPHRFRFPESVYLRSQQIHSGRNNGTNFLPILSTENILAKNETSTENKESLLQGHPEVRSQEISENAAIFSAAVIVCTGYDFLSGFHEDILRKSWGQSPYLKTSIVDVWLTCPMKSSPYVLKPTVGISLKILPYSSV
jgi:hypothetical protein